METGIKNRRMKNPPIKAPIQIGILEALLLAIRKRACFFRYMLTVNTSDAKKKCSLCTGLKSYIGIHGFAVAFIRVVHFKMNQEGQQRPEDNHGTQYGQFTEVPDQNGL